MSRIALGPVLRRAGGNIHFLPAASSLTLVIAAIVGHVGGADCGISPGDNAAEKNHACAAPSSDPIGAKRPDSGAKEEQATIIQGLVAAITGNHPGASLLAGKQLFEECPQHCAEIIEAVNKADYSARKRATWSLTGAALGLDSKSRRKCDSVLRGLLPTLIEIAHDGDKVDRGSAAAWMGILVGGRDASEEDRQRVLPVLTALLSDSEAYTRWKAIEGVFRMGPFAKPLVPVLAERLNDPAAYVRQSACLTLGAMGPEASEAIPKLREVVQQAELKDVAQDALRRICDESAKPKR